MENNQTKKILLAAYGSLRLHQYNYKFFKENFGEDFRYVKTKPLYGYWLYDLGYYPAVLFSDDGETVNSKLIVDIIECSEEVYSIIKDMELGAGYFESEHKVNEETFKIFVYKDSTISSTFKTVESGDWSKFLLTEKEPF